MGELRKVINIPWRYW